MRNRRVFSRRNTEAGGVDKVVNHIYPQVVDDDNFGNVTKIDTDGYAFCRILVILGQTDVAMTALKVQESDTSGSGYEDVPGLDYAGSLPGASWDHSICGFDINLTSRKRYLQVVATTGDGTAGTALCVVALLSEKAQPAKTAQELGLAALRTA